MANCYNDCLHCLVCKYADENEYRSVQQLKDDCCGCLTASDVAPKSKVAKEIFDLIENAFCPAFDYKGYEIKQYLAELKKKYTEGTSENRDN